MKVEEDWGKLRFASADNPVQNILRKVKKSSKMKQTISVFANFLSTSSKNVFLPWREGTILWVHAVLGLSYYLLIYLIKGTVMQSEKALINDHLRVSEVQYPEIQYLCFFKKAAFYCLFCL